jgi:hypothetical protein
MARKIETREFFFETALARSFSFNTIGAFVRHKIHFQAGHPKFRAMKRNKKRSSDPSVGWTRSELKLLSSLSSPDKIQAFLDTLEYSSESRYRSPRSVLRDRTAHCYDGAVFAAMALRRLGYLPLIVDVDAVRDDDHVIAIFKRHGRFGAIAKSNFVGLRYREPVYISLRELVMSYFESFYNINYEKTLRQYTRPLNLSTFDVLNWTSSDAALDAIADKLNDIRVYKILTAAMARSLFPVDQRTYDAGMLGVKKAGLYKP